MATSTYLEAINQALFEEMERDERVFLLGEDIGIYGGAFKVTKGLYKAFGGERVIDTPISESAIIGSAIGAAITGLRPVAEMQFADFITVGFNQLVANAATLYYRHNIPVPMVVRAPSGGGIRGGPFHSKNPEAWFFHQPGLKIVAPATARDAKGLLKSSIRDNNPVIYFEHKYLYRRVKEELPEEEVVVPLGKATVSREGDDVTVITYGAMVFECLDAAKKLFKEHDISAQVIDLRTLQPLDMELILESVQKTSRVVIVHEAGLSGGIGAEIAARISENAFEYLDAPIKRIASLDTPTPFSPILENEFMPNAEKIYNAILEIMKF
jgi:2-oxoisovalerate dehydrogenase E1 component beta subunit